MNNNNNNNKNKQNNNNNNRKMMWNTYKENITHTHTLAYPKNT